MKRKTDNFNKFFNRKRNSAVKEEFKQEKKAAKKERKEAIERHFEEKRQARWANQPSTEQYSKPGFSKKGAAAPAPRPTHAPAFGAGNKTAADGSQDPNLIPLNKYIAHGGICSRRDAADLIKLGKVLVNGQAVTEPGTKVSPSDLVLVNGKKVTISRNFIYILLNKPKDYITTTDDPQGRKTVLDLTRQATQERVFPVGRLDRNTSGVLLLTNDGDLAQKLAHPKHEIKKIYHVSLDKPLTKADFDKIIGGGVNLEDGIANVDVLAYEDPKDKTQIGLEIHSGRNRIVRRIFEHLGYDVRGLDRVMYAGLTKKNVQRGKWRLLTEKEIRILKYLNSSTRSAAQNKAIQAEQAAYRNKKTALDREVDEFLENDEQPEEKPIAATPDKSGKKPFRSKNAAAGKRSSTHLKDFGEDETDEMESVAGKKDFGGKTDFAAKKSFAGRGEKKSFGPKKEFTGKKEFGDRKASSDRKAPGDRKGPGARKKGFGGKKAFGGPDKAPYRGKSTGSGKRAFDGKKEFSDKQGFEGKKSFGPKKEFTGKKEFGDRKGPGERKEFGDRKAPSDQKAPSDRKGPGARKEGPGGKKAFGGPDKGPSRGKSAGSSARSGSGRPAPSKGKGRPSAGRPSGRPSNRSAK